jgi:glucose-6-phosphate dehydrogenase assembly protein OpcA
MAFDPSSLGLPVELAQIPKQLKALWDDEEHRTRACLLNLVVYCQNTDEFTSNTQLISQFVRDHACRAILVGDVPSESPKSSAWVQAHCHLTKAGAQEICSEQITLLAEGLSQTAVANLIMSNLDYDLPLNLWWQGPFPKDATSPLWQRVDRLIFDSSLWDNPGENLHRLTLVREHFGTHLTLADLNWTRTLGIRQAAAQCFDNPALLREINNINHLEIRHSSDSKLAALLLASWFAAQFGWMVDDSNDTRIQFRSASGAQVLCTFLTGLGASVTGITLKTSDNTLSIEREAASGLLNAITKTDSGTSNAHYPSGNCDLLSLLSEDMTPGNRHRVYLKALTILQVLLP